MLLQFFSVAKFLLSAFNHRKELLQDFEDG